MSGFIEEPSPGTVVAEAKPRPRRRWLRFSLRTFMIAVTLFCAAAGVVRSKAMRQKRAVERVKAAQTYVVVLYDFQFDEKLSPRAADRAPPGPDWLRNLIGIDYFATVASVQVNVAKDELLSALPDLPSLRSLRIACDSKISDTQWRISRNSEDSNSFICAESTTLE